MTFLNNIRDWNADRRMYNIMDIYAALGSAEAVYYRWMYVDLITVPRTESAQSVYRLNINFQISMGMRLQPVPNQKILTTQPSP